MRARLPVPATGNEVTSLPASGPGPSAWFNVGIELQGKEGANLNRYEDNSGALALSEFSLEIAARCLDGWLMSHLGETLVSGVASVGRKRCHVSLDRCRV